MDTNSAAWMIAVGPRIELQSTIREREQLYAFRESQHQQRLSLLDRLRGITKPRSATLTADIDLVCCTA